MIGKLLPASRPSLLPLNRWPLPEVLERLAAIERRVESLDQEVTTMRQGVESVGVNVRDLRDAIHPFQRTAGRLGRLTVRRPRSSRAD